MQREMKIGAVTVEKIINAAEGLKGLKKNGEAGIVNKLAGKYAEVGKQLKKEGKTSVDLIRKIREEI